MNRITTTGLVATVAILAATAGVLTRQTTEAASPPAQSAEKDSASRKLMALELPDSKGVQQALKQWQGQVLVVNFWATWCPPCRKEIPEFGRLSQKYRDRKVQFVGISIDTPKNVVDFQAKMKVPYPLLIASPQVIALTEELGNSSQGLPFTVIYARNGSIAQVKLGTLSETELDARLAALSGS